MHHFDETVVLGWCDSGMTDAKFTEGLMATMIHSPIQFVDFVRVNGNQIGRQRQTLIDTWYAR